MDKDFCIFILSHGRADRVITLDTIKKAGNTYPVYIIIDNEDKTANEYYKRYGKDRVIMFDKIAMSKKFDEADNFDNRKSIVYARNACFDIAEKLGYKYFLQLDDDYTEFKFRINGNSEFPKDRFLIRSRFNQVISHTLSFYKNTKSVTSIAFSQGGDWMGGESNFKRVKRKAMNTFFCSTERRFQFLGRINEDVNTYTKMQSIGMLFLTTFLIQIDQLQTQSNQGGMTDIYLDGGTYIKSFYSVIFHPSSVSVRLMGRANRRLHHHVNWNNTVPKIINPGLKK